MNTSVDIIHIVTYNSNVYNGRMCLSFDFIAVIITPLR